MTTHFAHCPLNNMVKLTANRLAVTSVFHYLLTSVQAKHKNLYLEKSDECGMNAGGGVFMLN